MEIMPRASPASKSGSARNPRPTSGVLAARAVTLPPKPKVNHTLSSHVYKSTAEYPTKTEAETADPMKANERLLDDSEFLVQATLFLQTAEEQLNSIESTLKRPKFPRKLLGLSIENCEEKEYAQEIVGAILRGHDVKREEKISIPPRLRKRLLSRSATWNSETKKQQTDKPLAKSTNKEMTEISRQSNASPENGQILNFVPCRSADELTQRTTNHAVSQSTIPENGGQKFVEESPSPNNTRYKAYPTKNKARYEEYPVPDETRYEEYETDTTARFRLSVPGRVTRKKMTIKDVPILKSSDLKALTNAAMINVQCNSASLLEDDESTKSKSDQNTLTIQVLPSINIKPELTQETFTQVDIQPSKSLKKEFAVNKNIQFIKIVRDDDVEKEASSQRCEDNTGRAKKKPSLKAVQMTAGSNSSGVVCNKKMESSLPRSKKNFDRGRLNEILNAVTDKLTAHVEIPDKILENAINRLWVLGDYLEDVYTNSTEGFRQKVRLSFTSLWLHEIIRLMDVEMKRGANSMKSGIATIVHYIVSEIQCESSVSHQQACIIAEENDEIRFYCKHDSPVRQTVESKHPNRASAFQKLSNSRIIRNSGGFLPPNSLEGYNSIGSQYDIEKPKYADSSSESNLGPKIPSPSNHELAGKASNRSSHQRSQENDGRRQNQPDPCLPEKLVPTESKQNNKKEDLCRHNLNFYEKNKFIDADQRQKVIQKLGEEVKKMLSWHEQLQLRNYYNEANRSNHFISKNSREKPNTSTSLGKIRPTLTISSDVKASNLNSSKKITSEPDFQETAEEVKIESAPSVSSESNKPEKVSHTSSSGEVAYEDDWEEDFETSAKNEDGQHSHDRTNSDDSKSSRRDAHISAPSATSREEQNEPKSPEFSATIGGSQDAALQGSANASTSNGNHFVIEDHKNVSSEQQESEESRLRDKTVEKESSTFKNQEDPSNNVPVAGGEGNTPIGSETDIASDLSDWESSFRNTQSDNAQKSNSDSKVSNEPSSVETVHDLSHQSNEASSIRSRASMSLRFEENSFKENDSGIVQQSDCDLTSEESALSRGGCEKLQSESFQRSDQCNQNVSMKLSKSCQELAENVLRIELMKNDLLRVLTKPESELLQKVSCSRSLPEVGKKLEEECDKLRPNSAPALKSGDSSLVSGTVSENDTETETTSVERKISGVTVTLENDCESNNESESNHGDSQTCHVLYKNVEADKAFSDLSSESSVNVLVNNRYVLTPSEVTIEPIALQPVLVPKRKNEVPQPTHRVEGVIDDKKGGNRIDDPAVHRNSVAQSFAELSNDILKHLELESELLTQLYSASTINETSSEAGKLKSETEGAVSETETAQNFNAETSSLSESEPDQGGVLFVSSDASVDFESLMSKLSENMGESLESSEDISGDSVDELFSIISSERFKVDCSKGLEDSIKEVLCSDTMDKGDFAVEHF